ncbi:hypothetical protein [Sporomusa sp.]|uniref:glycosyltransferase n=1 Tax=Sporomusa sp. TaxID=2078658 RepID=UPI002CA28EB6|nr:hypothetical protein [Sporomusa sp.]HWR45838.1 hypothetical protein [Sporomusa sp.]
MKILLLGEFSGVHKNLKEGLVELGHRVTTASSGDGWKNIPADIVYAYGGYGLVNKLRRVIDPIIKLPYFIGYDVVQLINPFIFSYRINAILQDIILQLNDRVFLLAAGCDSVYCKNSDRHQYSPCETCKKIDLNDTCNFKKEELLHFNRTLADKVQGIIPIAYDYAEVYRNYRKLRKSIPLPINTKEILYKDNIVQNKLILFHGINREGFKGTPLIQQAAEYVQQKYPNDVTVIIDGKMPLNRYLEVVDQAHVIIDQLYSQAYGVNAIYALAKGKVVLGGSEEHSLGEFGWAQSPVINIRPSVTDIIEKFEYLIENRQQIRDWGFQGRKHVETVHDHINVAKQYVSTWSIDSRL